MKFSTKTAPGKSKSSAGNEEVDLFLPSTSRKIKTIIEQIGRATSCSIQKSRDNLRWHAVVSSSPGRPERLGCPQLLTTELKHRYLLLHWQENEVQAPLSGIISALGSSMQAMETVVMSQHQTIA